MISKYLNIYILALLVTASVHAPLRASVILDEEEVVFRYEESGAERVFVVGDFNGWNPTLDRMVRREGGFELRLFLVPGKYRYMFVVDGERIADPDNPYIDAEGMTFFIFLETNSGYELIFELPETGGSPAEKSEYDLSLRGFVERTEEEGSVWLLPRLEGLVNGTARISLAAGLEYRSRDTGGDDVLSSSLVRASASYEADRGSITAFSRSADLSLGDTLALFGTVGPFGYPLGTFCRGVDVEGELAFGISGRAFYASRLSGYESALSRAGCFAGVSSGISFCDPLYADRGLEDSEMTGIRVSAGKGGYRFGYLFRHDLRARRISWDPPDDSMDILYSGLEKLDIHGITLRFTGLRNTVLDAEYLRGYTSLSSVLFYDFETESMEEAGYDLDWESGSRAYAGISYDPGRLSLGFSWRRTAIGGDPFYRNLREKDVLNSFSTVLEWEAGDFWVRLTGSDESGSEDGSAYIFGIQRFNFWLDGDALGPADVQFLDTRGVISLELAVQEEKNDTMRAPYDAAGSLSLMMKRDKYRSGRGVFEARIEKGVRINEIFTSCLDLRYVYYDDERMEGSSAFLDAWIGLCCEIQGDLWFAFGIGVPPVTFDNWLYGYSAFGREKYLLGQGVFDSVPGQWEYPETAEALRAAEEEMAGDWMISFEAGMEF